ncbi:MAG: hypothetical protein P1U87_09395 [Verrucomicrobiales bacterium]|nr:hypothetical protein [Verrucomicrobiales bacterium]
MQKWRKCKLSEQFTTHPGGMSLIQKIVRFKFLATSRAAADRLIRVECDRTLAICRGLGDELCAASAEIPALLGVDEEMRSWSLFQILEHNTIVNHRITEQVLFALGEGPEPDPDFDVKHDVLPAGDSGPDQVAAFEESVDEHLRKVAGHSRLRGTPEADHPLFGPFDAHKWNCMFGFHLQLHRKQAEAVAKRLKTKANGDL